MKRESNWNKLRAVPAIFAAAILVAATIPICSAADNLPKVNWRCQSCLSPPEKIYGGKAYGAYGLAKLLATKVKERTNGKFNIRVLPPGTLIKPMETASGVMKGAVEMGLTIGVLYTGVIPEADFTTNFPFGPIDNEAFWKVITETDFLKIMRDVYAKHNLYYLARFSAGADSYITTFPIRKSEDLKGHKIRTGGIIAHISKEYGAVPVNISISELYTAMQRKTVDGFTASIYIGNAYKLFEVAKYVSQPSLFNTGPEVTVNLKAFNKLPKEYREILMEEAYKISDFSHNINAVKIDALTRSVAESKYNVTYTQIPPEEWAKMKKLAMPYWDKLSEKSPECAKLMEIWRKYGQ